MAKVQPFNPRTNRLLAALEPDDFGLLAPDLEPVVLNHRQVLYDTGATMRWAYFPHDTIVSLVNELEDGGTVEVAVFGHLLPETYPRNLPRWINTLTLLYDFRYASTKQGVSSPDLAEYRLYRFAPQPD